MTDKKKLENLKDMILSKRDHKRHQKELADEIKTNKDIVENTIMEEGDIAACRELLNKNQKLESTKKAHGDKVKDLEKNIEAIILDEGEYEGQMTIDDIAEDQGD